MSSPDHLHTRRARVRRAAATAVLLVALGSTATATAAAPTVPDGAAPQSGDWATWQHDARGSRHNADERALTPATVGLLEPAWALAQPARPNSYHGSQPAVVDGTLYVGNGDATLSAVDAESGAARWTFDTRSVAGPADAQSPNPLRDGPAVAGGIVYAGDSRGHVYGVDAGTGELVWSTRVDDHPTARLTSSPLVHRGTVYIGVSSSESGLQGDPTTYPCCTFRGQVVALDARSGAVRWRHHTVAAPRPDGAWPSGQPRSTPSGNGVWASPVIDDATGTLFVGTGQNYTGRAAGDVDTMLALDVRTGSPRWTRRMVEADTYTIACSDPALTESYCPARADDEALDFDIGATANLFTVGGRTVVGFGQKNGVYQALDAGTGRTVWERRLSTPDLGDADPGGGGVEWGSSYDGTHIYVTTWRPEPTGTLFALDPATGAVVWRTDAPAAGCSTGGAAAGTECFRGFTAAASSTPGLVHVGTADGKMRVFAADTGRQLWEFDTIRDVAGVNGLPGRGSAISGNGGAVVADGMLYVQSAYYPFYPTEVGGVLLAFRLPA